MEKLRFCNYRETRSVFPLILFFICHRIMSVVTCMGNRISFFLLCFLLRSAVLDGSTFGRPPIALIAMTAGVLLVLALAGGAAALWVFRDAVARTVVQWEKLPEPRHPFSLEIISPTRPSVYVNLGPHPPRLWPEDVDLVHNGV